MAYGCRDAADFWVVSSIVGTASRDADFFCYTISVKKIIAVLTDTEFRLPIITLALGVAGFASGYAIFYLFAIAIGLFGLGIDSAKKLWNKQFSLDYIAILAMVVSLATNELLAGAVISLMILVSEALEEYGSREAEAALKHLVEKIPKTCEVKAGERYEQKKIQDVCEGDVILVRPEEIVPLDGHLLSPRALVDESNLTGELEPQDYRQSQLMKSGLVNVGSSVELRVSGDFSTSTYQKIVDLVRETKTHPARIVRLAEQYNYGFTVVTLLMAGAAYLFSHDPTRLLAVLVIATPCPLLIAAPVSFLGGLNKASRKNVIIKRPAALETLSTITTIFFDKTGTLTLGTPTLRSVEIFDKEYAEEKLLAFAAAIELHSLHPIAKAIVRAADERKLPAEEATQIKEILGEGITGTIKGGRYLIKKSTNAAISGIAIDLFYRGPNPVVSEGVKKVFSVGGCPGFPARRGGPAKECREGLSRRSNKAAAETRGIREVWDFFNTLSRATLDDQPIGRFLLDDVMKPGTAVLLGELTRKYDVAILTGDSEENAKRLFGASGVTIHAHCLPEDKYRYVKAAQGDGARVMMVGDGLNDAPALALADVGVVFSGSENSASIDAAAVAILSRDISLVEFTLTLAENSTRIARQSIRWGIGLSIIGMIFAAFGFIPPVTGAILQEGIDITVILNALRAA